MNAGMTVVDACREAGVARSTFYDFLKSNPEVITEIQIIIETTQREQLGIAIMASTQILGKLIEDGLAEETKPRDRLAIYLKLQERIERLSQTSTAQSEMERQAYELLTKGPTLKVVESCFTALPASKAEENMKKPDRAGQYSDILG